MPAGDKPAPGSGFRARPPGPPVMYCRRGRRRAFGHRQVRRSCGGAEALTHPAASDTPAPEVAPHIRRSRQRRCPRAGNQHRRRVDAPRSAQPESPLCRHSRWRRRPGRMAMPGAGGRTHPVRLAGRTGEPDGDGVGRQALCPVAPGDLRAQQRAHGPADVAGRAVPAHPPDGRVLESTPRPARHQSLRSRPGPDRDPARADPPAFPGYFSPRVRRRERRTGGSRSSLCRLQCHPVGGARAIPACPTASSTVREPQLRRWYLRMSSAMKPKSGLPTVTRFACRSGPATRGLLRGHSDRAGCRGGQTRTGDAARHDQRAGGEAVPRRPAASRPSRRACAHATVALDGDPVA